MIEQSVRRESSAPIVLIALPCRWFYEESCIAESPPTAKELSRSYQNHLRMILTKGAKYLVDAVSDSIGCQPDTWTHRLAGHVKRFYQTSQKKIATFITIHTYHIASPKYWI